MGGEKTTGDKKPMTIRLQEELYNDVTRLSEKSGRGGKSAFIEEALRLYINLKKDEEFLEKSDPEMRYKLTLKWEPLHQPIQQKRAAYIGDY